jgi:hypothetical protein
MSAPPRKRVVLLPERRLFNGQTFSPAFAIYARRFNSSCQAPDGESAQLQRYFQCIPQTWPMAAVFRQQEHADAETQQWLRADPIFLQLEMRGARVMAWGNLPLSLEEKKALLSALKPVFGDQGFELSFSRHDFFYIRALTASPIPAFAPAPDILGCDLAGLLPDDKKWAAIFNECQIILHNHPLNVARQRQGKVPINGLWFWGQGSLPTAIYHHFEIIESDAGDLQALRAVALMHTDSEENTLLDLRHVRDFALVEAAFKAGISTCFDFADGVQWHWRPNYKWHFWRRSSLTFR